MGNKSEWVILPMFGPKENSEERSTWLLRGSQRDRVAVDHSGNRLSNKLSCWLFFLLYVACPSHQFLFPGIISQINTLSQSQILQVRPDQNSNFEKYFF